MDAIDRTYDGHAIEQDRLLPASKSMCELMRLIGVKQHVVERQRLFVRLFKHLNKKINTASSDDERLRFLFRMRRLNDYVKREFPKLMTEYMGANNGATRLSNTAPNFPPALRE